MSYQEALTAAGATVHSFENFGSYQGDWWAKVTYNNTTGWVTGSFGSCSGCDAFEAEFGWQEDKCEDHRYNYEDAPPDCANCEAQKESYNERFKRFGLDYLETLLTQEEAIAKASEHIDWDSDAEEMVKYIKDNAL